MAHDVFISYSRRDLDVANTIRDALESAGIDCWIDTRDERGGLGWAEQIVSALKGSRAVVLIHSRHTPKSDVPREIGCADDMKLPVVPVRVDSTPMAGGGLEYLVGRIQWIDASDGLEPKLSRIVSDVARFTGTIAKSASAAPPPVPRPYEVERRRAVVTATEDTVRLPAAEWMITDDDQLRVRLQRREDEIARLRAAIIRVQTVDNGRLLIQTTIDVRRGVLEANLRGWRPYAQVAAEWREDLAVALPSIVGLGHTIADLCRLHAAAGGVLLPLSPLYLFHNESSGVWRAVAIPAADVTLFEWASADPIAWAWASADALAGKRSVDDRYAVGAALHETLTGSLFAPLLPPTERFRRVLAGRVGLPHLLESVIESALPPSYVDEKSFFLSVVDSHLFRPLVDRATGTASDALLEELEERLSPRRLALRWEFENRIDHALLLLERYSSKDVIGDAWQSMARIFIKKGEPDRAADIVGRALESGSVDAIRQYLSIVPLSRTPGDVLRENLRRAVRSASINGNASDDISALLLAHVEARHLRDNASAINRLQRRAFEGWPAVLCHVVLARTLADYADQYPLVSRLATEACQMIKRRQRDDESRYAEAYLLLLNGIVNYAAVGELQNPSYLADSYQSFVDSLECSLREVIAPLIAANVQWLQWIAASARLMTGPEYSLMNVGISAYLNARGLSQRATAADMRFPAIPWYDENLLFHIEEAP